VRLDELLQIDAEAFPLSEIPSLLGALAALDARLKLRLLVPSETQKDESSDRELELHEVKGSQ
jgi:hypothetical protein